MNTAFSKTLQILLSELSQEPLFRKTTFIAVACSRCFHLALDYFASSVNACNVITEDTMFTPDAIDAESAWIYISPTFCINLWSSKRTFVWKKRFHAELMWALMSWVMSEICSANKIETFYLLTSACVTGRNQTVTGKLNKCIRFSIFVSSCIYIIFISLIFIYTHRFCCFCGFLFYKNCHSWLLRLALSQSQTL